MGLLKLFKTKSNSAGEQPNRSHSFSSSIDNEAPLPRPPGLGSQPRSVSTSSVKSGSGFLGRNTKDRAQSQLSIKTIPYESMPPQRPPQPRSASGSSHVSSPRTPHGYAHQPSRLSSLHPHMSNQPSPTSPLQAEPQNRQNPRPPYSNYVLPDLNLDTKRTNAGPLLSFPTTGPGVLPSPRNTVPEGRRRNESDRSQDDRRERRTDDQRMSSLHTSADRRGHQDTLQPHSSDPRGHMDVTGQRSLPEPPSTTSRPSSTFNLGTSVSSASTAHDPFTSQSSNSASSGSATPRPSLSINPVVLAEPSVGMRSTSNRSENHLALPSSSNSGPKANSNQSVFPWLNRSRSKSPNPFGEGSAPMIKSKSKEKSKGKPKAENDDSSFKVRAFRHVSSGSGIPPWEVQFEHESPQRPRNAEAQRSESDPVVQRRPDSRYGSPPPRSPEVSAGQRPSLQGLGRPPSVAGSINSEYDTRRLSVQRFKQTRRYSGISVNEDQAVYKTQGQGHQRVRSDSSGQEVLLSPPRKRTGNLDLDDSDEEVLAPSRLVDKEDSNDVSTASRAMNRSFSTSALTSSAVISTGSSTSVEEPITSRRSMDQSMAPGVISHPPQRPPGFTVQGRRALSVFDQSAQINVPSGGKGTPQPRNRPFGHDRSRSASGIQDLSAEIKHAQSSPGNSSQGRLALHERLAGLAVSTPPMTELPLVSSPECEIPPVPRSPSPDTPKAAPDIPRPSSSQALVALRPVTQQRSYSNTSHNRQKARTGWDASSSDEGSDTDKKPLRKVRTTSASKPPQATFKVQSLPSGVRRPPAPSEAFGNDEDEPSARSSVAGSQGSRTSSFGSNRSAPTSSFQRPRLSIHSRNPSNALADSSDSSDSSEDEPLTAIKQKQSSSSLASRASLAIPGVQTKASSQKSSPAKSSRSNSNMSLPPMASSVNRSAVSPSSLPAVSPAMSPSQASCRLSLVSPAVPRPPTSFVTGGMRTRDSPASSQSGATTGDTSSGGLPVTPKELTLALSNPVALHSARSSFSSTQFANNPRRVSFAENEKGQAARNAEDDGNKEQSRKTNERRREEARKATEVCLSRRLVRPNLAAHFSSQIGQAANGTPEENDAPVPDPAAILQQMHSQVPQYAQMPNGFNFGMTNAPFMDPTQQMYMLQMQMAQMAQMAQMNPGMMQMQQQA